nr:cell division protein FtsQ/DivIB [Arthrobacter roseus]
MVLVIFTPLLQIRTITVEGTRLSASENVYLALEPLKDRTLVQVSESDARHLLKDLPAVKNVETVAVPPSTLQVTVHEYIPVAVLEQGKSFVLIDETGRKLGSAKDRASAKLPLIEGGTAAVNSDVFSSVTSVLASLPEEVLSRLKHASAKSVDSVQLRLEDGRRVFWGSADENAAKARVLQALLQEPRSDPPVTEFDVSTPERPVTRIE